MSESIEHLIAVAARLVVEQTSALIALLDVDGNVLGANPRLRQILATHPEMGTIFALLEPHSRRRFQSLLMTVRPGNHSEPVMLNMSETPTAVPQSYRTIVALTASEEYIFFAELIAPLDQNAAEEYIQITSQLATTTRNLQKTSHELARKQQELEAALSHSEYLARTDDLTGVLNRRSMMLLLGQERDRARRYESPLSILMMDIDYFKHVNDDYGHMMGDHVLRECAAMLRRSVRASDHLGRYGGEEFLAILPMTPAEAAVELAQRLNHEVAHMRFFASETINFRVTISIGVAQIRDHETPDHVLIRADTALYQAKARGRNCVVLWQDEEMLDSRC